ncbi:MAG: hypothetical protein JNL50_15050, partial [Phycisphaerae bacterium]|nr:hypothetical protein [Phycisphaerae bacterium]
ERELEGFEEREGTRKRRELGGIRGERRNAEGRRGQGRGTEEKLNAEVTESTEEEERRRRAEGRREIEGIEDVVKPGKARARPRHPEQSRAERRREERRREENAQTGGERRATRYEAHRCRGRHRWHGVLKLEERGQGTKAGLDHATPSRAESQRR